MKNIYVLLLMAGLVGGLGFAANIYHGETQARIEELAGERETLLRAVATNEETIVRLGEEAARQRQLNTVLQAELREAEAGLDQIRDTLSDHDLTRLALGKPGLVERRINDATKAVFDQIESDTGGGSAAASPGV